MNDINHERLHAILSRVYLLSDSLNTLAELVERQQAQTNKGHGLAHLIELHGDDASDIGEAIDRLSRMCRSTEAAEGAQ